jgi:DNA polymerase-3 subunit epsilon
VLNKLIYHYKKRRYAPRAENTPLDALYQRPYIDLQTPFCDQKFTIIDCEMSGLNPQKDRLLSIGWVNLQNGRIQASSAAHRIIYSEGDIGDSVLIHKLEDHKIAAGAPRKDVLTSFLEDLTNSIAVFHHAPIDLAFLQQAIITEFGAPMLLPYIDTMNIERRKLNQRDKSDSLRLPACRQRYGLPYSMQHDALNDAQATAELFLAQAHHISSISSLHVKDFPLRYS